MVALAAQFNDDSYLTLHWARLQVEECCSVSNEMPKGRHNLFCLSVHVLYNHRLFKYLKAKYKYV